MKLTIAICTYKRYELIGILLKKIEALKFDYSETEILVIDNTPSAERKEINCNFAEVIHSSPPGLSRARNLAIESAKGEYIAFIDDDAYPSASWHSKILEVIHNSGGKYSILCGPIRPVWPNNVEPYWLPQKYKGCLTILDYGTKSIELDEWQYAYGANMIFRTSSVKDIGGFSTELGRVGNSTLLSDEEINLQKKLKELGLKSFYHPEIEVFHVAHEERLSKNYFIGRMSWQAVSDLIQQINLNNYDANMYLGELLRTNPKLVLPILNLISNYEDTHLEEKIDVITALIRVLLSISLMSDEQANLRASNHASLFNKANFLEESISRDKKEIRLLFIESKQNHSFLYNEYSKIKHSRYISIDKDLWNEDIKYEEISEQLKKGIKQIHFITIDPFVYGWGMPFLSILKKNGYIVTGMLHRVLDDNLHKHKIKLACDLLDCIYTPSLIESNRYPELKFLPLPPTINDYLIFESKKNADTKNTFKISMVGEIREGKSFDLVLKIMKKCKQKFGEEVQFIYIGKSSEFEINILKKNIKNNEINLNLKLASSDSKYSYKVKEDSELVLVYRESNLGFLLYEGEQVNCASGNMANYARLEVPVLTLRGSNVAKEAVEGNVGIAVDSNVESIIEEIEKVKNNLYKFNFKKYNQIHAIENIEKLLVKYET